MTFMESLVQRVFGRVAVIGAGMSCLHLYSRKRAGQLVERLREGRDRKVGGLCSGKGIRKEIIRTKSVQVPQHQSERIVAGFAVCGGRQSSRGK